MNYKYIPNNIWQAMRAIVNTHPEVVFGGSIALIMTGLLNRPPKDLDLFLPHTTKLLKSGLLTIEDSEITSETVTNTNGKEIQRVGFIVNGVKCCVFSVDDEELKHSLEWIGYPGNPESFVIRCQNVNYAIQAKLSYADRSGKHKEDLLQINDTLRSIDTLTGSEAVYGLLGWLSTRPGTLEIGDRHDASVCAELANLFCVTNDLQPPREEWHKLLTHPKE